METLSSKDVKKTDTGAKKPVPVQVIKKKTLSEEFLAECDEQESEIFEALKSVLMSQCEKREFEAVTEGNLESYSMVITYIKERVITLDSDGFNFELRKPLVNDKGEEITKKVKVLYKKNHDRYRTFTKGKKTDTNEHAKLFNIAQLAASFDNVDTKMISVEATVRLAQENELDYALLIGCLAFFRY